MAKGFFSKNYSVWLAVPIGLAALAIVYYVVKNKAGAATPLKNSGNTNTTPAPASDFPLHIGSKGATVMQLQQALVKKLGSSALPQYGVDGDFGSETQAALMRVTGKGAVDNQQELTNILNG